MCRCATLRVAVDFGPSPLANGYARPDALYEMVMMQCESCGHLQLADAPSADTLFEGYAYKASVNTPMFKELLATVKPHGTVVDIGSNDNTLLDMAAELPGVERTIGVDPYSDVTSYKLPWSPLVANDIADSYGGADFVFCTNTFAHLTNLQEAAEALRLVLKKQGRAIIQVPWARDMIINNLYDTVYHEHRHYFFVSSLVALFARHKLGITNIQYLPKVHGGTLRVWVGKHDNGLPTHNPLRLMLLMEKEANKEAVQWASTIDAHANLIGRLCDCYRHVTAVGISAKAVMLLHHSKAPIAAAMDSEPTKIGRKLPGRSSITIEPMGTPRGDAALITAWNYADTLIAQLRKGGFRGDCIVPFPVPFHDRADKGATRNHPVAASTA